MLKAIQTSAGFFEGVEFLEVLSEWFADAPPVVGLPTLDAMSAHFSRLLLGFEAAPLYCQDHVLALPHHG